MKKIIALLLALVMMFGLVACSNSTADNSKTSDNANVSDNANTPNTPDNSGASRDADGNGRIDKVYSALPADPVNLLPWDSKGNQRKIFYAAIYDTLFDFINGEYVPNVATGYTVVDDLHWEVKIHDNVKDWEGNPLNAHDIVFCYENYVNSGFAVKFDNFAGVEATDDYTLLFTWNKPNTAVAGLDHVLCNVQLYTEAAWDQDKFATSPVATGPYKLVEYVSGSKVVVEVNEDYWNDNPTEMRLQNADVIEYPIILEGAQNVISLQNGKLDISSNIPAENFEEFAADSNYYTASVPTNEIYVMLVNCETIPDANMRKALFYAIDSEALSTIINGSSPTKAYGSPASPDYVDAWEDMETYYNTYDVDKAKALLADSSYSGETLHMTCLNEEAYKNMATMVQVFWEQIGVKSEIETIDSAIQSAYSTDSSKWDINITNAGGSFIVNSMNRLYNTTDFGGEYSNGFVVDQKLWDLFGKANNAETWGEDTLTDMYQYITDMGYHYVLMYMNSSAVASNAVSGFYYWDSVILPHCCTYNLG
ncbi:MAG: ABC transporter substrate-binding protein [Oscillospiraceae bacterium]